YLILPDRYSRNSAPHQASHNKRSKRIDDPATRSVRLLSPFSPIHRLPETRPVFQSFRRAFRKLRRTQTYSRRYSSSVSAPLPPRLVQRRTEWSEGKPRSRRRRQPRLTPTNTTQRESMLPPN